METPKFLHKKSLGQHFLNSTVVPNWMCDAADIQTGDIVVEIGPGTGALTRELLTRGATVHALEADGRALVVLEKEFADHIATKRLVLHHEDVRDFSFTDLGLPNHSFKVVANIPYYLSGLLFRTCLSGEIQPRTMVFLVQKEVAKRVVEAQRGGKHSLLSLSVEAFGTPRYERSVAKTHFTPPPKVDSAIINVSDIHQQNFAELDQKEFFDLLHVGFGQKRKQLRTNLKKHYDETLIARAWETLDLSPTVRAEDVDLTTWLALGKMLAS